MTANPFRSRREPLSKESVRFLGWIECILIILVLGICFAGACVLPPDQCPDEPSRLPLTDYIVENGRLPEGSETGVFMESWQFSYAYFPYLSAIIGAFFAKIFTFFLPRASVYLLGARMCSVCSITGCCLFCLSLGKELFEKRSSAILFAVIVCFTPQVLFLGMYQNNDSLSLFSVSMILNFLVKGARNHWNVKNCVWLAVGISVCMLSYYSVYPWILFSVLFCCASCIGDEKIQKKAGLILKRAGIMFAVVALLAGWFFIRNAVIHDGDFLGFATKKLMKEKAIAGGMVLPNVIKHDLGYSFWQFLKENNFWWLANTAFSFVGKFGKMDLAMPLIRYFVYWLVLFGGVIAYAVVICRKRNSLEDWLLLALMLLSSLAVFTLSLCYSYFTDYQPQGRYVITLLLTISYMLSYASDHVPLSADGGTERSVRAAWILSAGWILLAFLTAFDSMSKMLPG